VLQTGLAAAFGFCAALFVVLLLAPAIARRISELTWRQAIRVLPQSSEEIAASRDHLRGQNAIEMRQLEMKMEAVAEKERHLRIGKQGFEDRIAALSNESLSLKDAIAALETEGGKLARDLNIAVERNAMLSTENADRDVRLATLSTEFSQLRGDHARQIAAFGLMEEAHKQADTRLQAARQELTAIKSKVSSAESEARMARTEAKRQESDAKLANRKVTALEGKLERSIRLIAEAEEKLERREAELKRLKDGAKIIASPFIQPVAAAKSPQPQALVETTSFPRQATEAPSEAIVAKIGELRPALRAAKTANTVERDRLKSEMMELAGRITAEAATQNAVLVTKVSQLKPGSALANAILKHQKAAE
jgi:DNA repair exonuclease SbcCD ATPase subunit